MAAVVSRILYTNRIRGSGVALVASSQQNSMPIAFLRDQLPSKPWRSLPGWTFDANNNKLDWDRGGVKVATLAGYFGNGADVAAHVQAQMQAADGGATYTVTYSTSTFKFTIACNLSITLKWSTGANAALSAGESLGYVVSADDSGTSNPADNASYQSVHFLKADLGSALLSQSAVAWNHNAGTGGTFTHQANATDAWTAPTLSQVLSGDSDIRIAFFADQTLRWRRLKINDVSNALGYSELGIWFDGPYTQPSICYSDAFENDPEELSALGFATGGAHFVDQRTIRDVFNIEYKEAPVADLTLLQTFAEATPKGKNFFFAFDPLNTPADTLYAFRAGPLRQDFVPGNYWDVSFPLAEALE